MDKMRQFEDVKGCNELGVSSGLLGLDWGLWTGGLCRGVVDRGGCGHDAKFDSARSDQDSQHCQKGVTGCNTELA